MEETVICNLCKREIPVLTAEFKNEGKTWECAGAFSKTVLHGAYSCKAPKPNVITISHEFRDLTIVEQIKVLESNVKMFDKKIDELKKLEK